MFPDARYRDSERGLDPGSTILLYTDGITEARCGNLFFGEQGLVSTVSSFSDRPIQELPSVLLEHALMFTGGTLADDIALLAVAYAGPTEKADDDTLQPIVRHGR